MLHLAAYCQWGSQSVSFLLVLWGSPGVFDRTLLQFRERMNLPGLMSVARLKADHEMLGLGHLLMLGVGIVRCPAAALFF